MMKLCIILCILISLLGEVFKMCSCYPPVTDDTESSYNELEDCLSPEEYFGEKGFFPRIRASLSSIFLSGQTCSESGLREWQTLLMDFYRTIQALHCKHLQRVALLFPSTANVVDNMEVYMTASIFEELSKKILSAYSFTLNHVPQCNVVLHQRFPEFHELYLCAKNISYLDPVLYEQIHNITRFTRVQKELHFLDLLDVFKSQLELREFVHLQRIFKVRFKSDLGTQWQTILTADFEIIASNFHRYIDLMHSKYFRLKQKIQHPDLLVFLWNLIFRCKTRIEKFILPPFHISTNYKSIYFTDSYSAMSLNSYTFESHVSKPAGYNVVLTKHARFASAPKHTVP